MFISISCIPPSVSLYHCVTISVSVLLSVLLSVYTQLNLLSRQSINQVSLSLSVCITLTVSLYQCITVSAYTRTSSLASAGSGNSVSKKAFTCLPPWWKGSAFLMSSCLTNRAAILLRDVLTSKEPMARYVEMFMCLCINMMICWYDDMLIWWYVNCLYVYVFICLCVYMFICFICLKEGYCEYGGYMLC